MESDSSAAAIEPARGEGTGGPAGAPVRGFPGPRGRQNHELIEGPITRTLVMFSLPVLGGNVLQSLNGSVNQFWVSHTLGISAITAIGNSNIVMMLMLGSIFGISMAANILVAQAVGAQFDLAAHNALNDVRSLAVTIRQLIRLGRLAEDWAETFPSEG